MSTPEPKPLKTLRPEHAQALAMLMEGATHAQVAQALGWSRWTVTRLVRKLDLGSELRAELSARFLKEWPATLGHAMQLIQNAMVPGLAVRTRELDVAMKVVRMTLPLIASPPPAPAQHQHVHLPPGPSPDPAADLDGGGQLDLFHGLDPEADHDRANDGAGNTHTENVTDD